MNNIIDNGLVFFYWYWLQHHIFLSFDNFFRKFKNVKLASYTLNFTYNPNNYDTLYFNVCMESKQKTQVVKHVTTREIITGNITGIKSGNWITFRTLILQHHNTLLYSS